METILTVCGILAMYHIWFRNERREAELRIEPEAVDLSSPLLKFGERGLARHLQKLPVTIRNLGTFPVQVEAIGVKMYIWNIGF